MADKTIFESPTITDTVIIPIKTPDANDCLIADPYKVDNVTIYYVERNFTGGNILEAESVVSDQDLEDQYQEAQNLACVDPTPANIQAAKTLRTEADSAKVSQKVFYNEAVPVASFGKPAFPAWLSTDTDNAFIEHVTTDDEGNTLYGHFKVNWTPKGAREGNYFVCWTWTPLPAGETLSANLGFILMGNTVVTTSIPTHFTPPEKYPTLLERYLPELYKDPLSEQDISPEVLNKLNLAVGKGFETVENLANQMVDLQDSNATHEAFLPLLAALFDLRLKSDDPTRWRKQIKNAVPLYKMKGTLAGLEKAFELAGMKLNRLIRLWQLISPYTWVDAFKVTETGTSSFTLSKVALTIDPSNFEVSVRLEGQSSYTALTIGDIDITTTDGISTITITNDDLILAEGDIFKVLYQYAEIPNPTQQDIENYIRLLPLADQRDETEQLYPLKNWNVRVLEEDDPLFSILIPNRHPYHDSLVFGKIRTEFPYSENVYNMEEYNGSIRDSKNPCDIDKNFLDPCSQCLGTKFLLDIEVENLSNDRIVEAQSIIEEMVPFHAVLHAVNFNGVTNDFVQPPVETIEALILYRGEETVISGQGQIIFNRGMINSGRALAVVYRNTLASSTLEASDSGTAYNSKIMLFSPDTPLAGVGLDNDPNNTVLEIYAPHPHAGVYQLQDPVNHAGEVVGTITEPVNQAAFSFSLSNIAYSNSNTSIDQNNYYTVLDPEWDLGELGVKTQWDVDHGGYVGSPWTIKMTAYSPTPYTIENILPDGSILLAHDATLPSSNATGVSYEILNPSSVTVQSGTLDLTVRLRGLVTVTDGTLTDIDARINQNSTFYLYYYDDTTQYKISDLVPGESHKFFIENWSSGGVAGKTVDIYQRLVDTRYGLLTYTGLMLDTPVDYESTLLISNGQNPVPVPLENSRFKENFLVKINDGDSAIDELFAIADIDGTTITLEGDIHYWKTLTGGGTPVTYEIYRYTKLPVTVDGTDFALLDRRGSEVITSTTETQAPFAMAATGGPEFSDSVRQEESIKFKIEYADGRVEEGTIN